MSTFNAISEGKCAKTVTLAFYLASISLILDWSFCTFALTLYVYRCQIHLFHNETFQMSYWRSWLSNFEDLWPKTSILCFEFWIILRLLNTHLAQMTYHCLLRSTNNNSQGKICSVYHWTQTCSKPTFRRPPSFIGDFYVKLSKKRREFGYFSGSAKLK